MTAVYEIFQFLFECVLTLRWEGEGYGRHNFIQTLQNSNIAFHKINSQTIQSYTQSSHYKGNQI